MIELYGPPTSNVFTIAIMLEEINYNYSIFPIHKTTTEHLDLEFIKQTPNNFFPLILDRDGPEHKPITVFETGAILIYLAEKSGQLIPQTPTARLETLQWLLFENAKISPTFSNTKHFMYHAPEEIPYALKRFNTEAKRIFAILESHLSENAFLASEYSIADIAAYPWLKEHARFGMSAEQIPAITQWLGRVATRPAIRKSLEAIEDLKEYA